MPNTTKTGSIVDIAERIKILEKAVGALGDSLEKRDSGIEDDVRELQTELKSIKVFLSRSIPEFKKQFPAIRQKIR